jgi:hypothetical protein
MPNIRDDPEAEFGGDAIDEGSGRLVGGDRVEIGFGFMARLPSQDRSARQP